MSTEQQIHVHLLLDRIREQQHEQGALLIDVIERQDESLRILRGIGKLLRDKPSKPKLSLPVGVWTTGLQYLAVASAIIYMLRGGDLEKLAPLLKWAGLL